MSSHATAILVLGMHRSGTSAVTRVLNLLGAHLGEDLLAAQADNVRGFWENAEAVAIHERLLTELGRTWYDTRELPYGWLHSPPARKAIGDIIALIERDMKGARLWAVKDPRMCRLAPLWIEALRTLAVDAKAVLVVREPYEVASSLHVRDGWSYPHAYLMWAQHLLDACHATTRIPRALLSYDQLLSDWSCHMARLGSELGITWEPGIEEAKPAIDAFLTPGARHHRASEVPADQPQDRRLPSYLEKLCRACMTISQNGDWEQLSDLDSQFREVAALFAHPMDEITQERDQAVRLSQERIEFVHHLQRELAESTRSQARMEALASERIERIHQLEAERTKLVTERAGFEALALERIERIHQVERDLVGRDEEIRRLREQLKELLSLAGNRWWAMKRALRPLKPVSSDNGQV